MTTGNNNIITINIYYDIVIENVDRVLYDFFTQSYRLYQNIILCYFWVDKLSRKKKLINYIKTNNSYVISYLLFENFKESKISIISESINRSVVSQVKELFILVCSSLVAIEVRT